MPGQAEGRRRNDVAKRELIDLPSGKRSIRRDARGRFTSDQVLVTHSLAADRRQPVASVTPMAQGARSDQRRPPPA
jgi:hypothetical protein